MIPTIIKLHNAVSLVDATVFTSQYDWARNINRESSALSRKRDLSTVKPAITKIQDIRATASVKAIIISIRKPTWWKYAESKMKKEVKTTEKITGKICSDLKPSLSDHLATNSLNLFIKPDSIPFLWKCNGYGQVSKYRQIRHFCLKYKLSTVQLLAHLNINIYYYGTERGASKTPR